VGEHLLGWIFRFVRRYWLTSGIFFTLVSSLIYSVEKAKWVSDTSPITYTFIVGLIFGWLLASSRFGGVFSLFYALLISILIPIQGVGKIVPPLRTILNTPLSLLVDGMNLRGWELSLRVTGWVETLRGGGNIQDTGLFVLLIGFILALCAIWLMWSMIRQQRALNGILPLAFLFAMNVHLSRQPLTNYAVFLFCGLLLIARTSFTRQHAEWDHRHVDYPEQLGIEWGGAALTLTLCIMILARLAPIFGTTEGLKALSDWINSYHQQTSNTATRLFSGVNPPPPQPLKPGEKPPVYVNTPNMGQIGAPIAQGTGVIMYVEISDPPPLPPEVGLHITPSEIMITHYWRNGIYGAYNGRGWNPVPPASQASPQPDLPKDPPAGRYYLRQNFELEAQHSGTLFSVNDPVQTDDSVRLHSLVEGASQIVEGKTSKYQVISEATRVTANDLASASIDYSPEIRAMYLQLPDSLPDRVRILSQRLVAGQNDPYHKALAIQTYLRENFKYDTDVQASPAKRDVVDYFLFDLQAGFCSHYASAMAVMLRTVGVPARVVSGYAMGSYDQQKGAFRVVESAAHAWVEVYFPGYGWVEFEPTAARAAIQYPEVKPMVVGNTRLNATKLDRQPKFDATRYLAWLVVIAALALLVMPFLLLRMFSTARLAPVIAVDVLYRRMRRVLAWAGLRAAPSVTPDEYLASYSGQLNEYQRLSQALSQVTALYRETVYSPRPPEEARVKKANRAWQQSFNEWLKLWLRARWKQLKARVTE
jgi:transglutaminase-like putative cysteine protease